MTAIAIHEGGVGRAVSDSEEDSGRTGRAPSETTDLWSQRASLYLRRHRRQIVLWIAAACVVIRVLYFLQMSSGPGLFQHRWEESDMHFFHAWATVIAGGDWLTDRALHPYHSWHDAIARRYFQLHPDDPDRPLAGEEGLQEPGRALWNRWYGGKRFHQEPLYPYLIAATQMLLGRDVRWVYAWQMLLGVLSNILIYLIARRAFGDMVGVVAAVLATLCAPLLFYEFLLLRATLLVATGLALVWLTLVAFERGTWSAWGLLGFTAGVALLLKTTFTLYVAALLVVLMGVHRKQPQRALRPSAALAAGILVCLAPVVARNIAVGAPPLSLTSVGTIGLIFANAEDASATGYSFLIEHGAEIMGRSNGRALPAALATLKTHDSPWSYLQLLGRRLLRIWHWVEVPNNANFYFFRLQASILRRLPVTFLVLAPLSLIGYMIAARRARRCWPLYLMSGSVLLSLLAYGNLSRYRILLLAVSIPFAALAIVGVAERLLQKRYLAAAAIVASLIVVSLWTASPPQGSLLRAADYGVADRVYYLPRRQAAARAGDWTAAQAVLDELLRIEPVEVRELDALQPPRSELARRLAGFYAGIYRDSGYALSRAGHSEAAAAQQRRARELQRIFDSSPAAAPSERG